MSNDALRQRILGALATSTLIAVACGGKAADPPSGSSGTSSGSSGTSSGASSGGSSTSSGGSTSGAPVECSGGRKERSCFAPNEIITKNSGYGGVRPADAAPPPPPTRDANGCVVLDEVMNGCCNAAISGPVLEGGKCCYEFCAGACCGRPLVVEGCARIASTTTRADWAVAFDVSRGLDPRTRAALRDAWTRDALLEHASIASFALFTLELMAVGAPPDLLLASQSAAADEIEHARITFAIASRYASAPLGPSALDVTRLAPSSDLATVAAAAVRDGCLNETLAAAIARAQAEGAEDAHLRDALLQIAEDEERHAELAWRFVKWALSLGDEAVRDAVQDAFRAPQPSFPSDPEGIDLDAFRRHGRLTRAEQASIARSVYDDVIAPCRDALLVALVPARERELSA